MNIVASPLLLTKQKRNINKTSPLLSDISPLCPSVPSTDLKGRQAMCFLA